MKKAVTAKWSGWTDDMSGVDEYLIEIFMLSPNSDGRLVEKEPLDPVQSFQKDHTGFRNVHNQSFVPNEPGMYR